MLVRFLSLAKWRQSSTSCPEKCKAPRVLTLNDNPVSINHVFEGPSSLISEIGYENPLPWMGCFKMHGIRASRAHDHSIDSRAVYVVVVIHGQADRQKYLLKRRVEAGLRIFVSIPCT